MPEMTRENAVAIVTRRFHAAHRSIEAAQEDALALHQAMLEAGRILGIHPNESSTAVGSVAAAVKDLAAAHQSVSLGHVLTKDLEPSEVQPLGGGNGKAWP